MKRSLIRTIFWLFLFGITGLADRMNAQEVAYPGERPPRNDLLAYEKLKIATKPNEAKAVGLIEVTNITDTELVLADIRPSCGCTTVQTPELPWHLPAHAQGRIGVAVNLLGKSGTFTKEIRIHMANKDIVEIPVTIVMPDGQKMREANMKIAQADRQAVFKGNCAKCHAEPVQTAKGIELFHKICGICHEARERASLVPNIRRLPHPTDHAYWIQWIANGKPGTMMPAFSQTQGGPLNDKQIEELAAAIERAYPPPRPGR